MFLRVLKRTVYRYLGSTQVMQSLQVRNHQDLNRWKSQKRFLTSNPKTEMNVISCAIPSSMVDTYLCKSMSCF